ncbi:MAG TPA: hypothetical protein PKE47_14405, partial [Verrucomicrobiota bacterium]|nr:hypothetical protein [Verrucomicrobiota bacterium]
ASLVRMADDPEGTPPLPPHSGAQFPPTQWSLVLDAFAAGTEPDPAALEGLIRNYLGPIYAYLRHQFRRLPPQDVEDLASEFATGLPALLSRVASNHGVPKGRLRSLLRFSARRFALDWLKKQKALKRGGDAGHVSLELIAEQLADSGEGSASAPDAEAAFDRAWAEALVHRAKEALAEDYRKPEAAKEHDALLPWLTADPPSGEHARLAVQLGCSEAASRQRLLRLRRDFRDHLRRAVLATLRDPADLEEEMRHLLNVLRSQGLP